MSRGSVVVGGCAGGNARRWAAHVPPLPDGRPWAGKAAAARALNSKPACSARQRSLARQHTKAPAAGQQRTAQQRSSSPPTLSMLPRA